MAHVGRHMPSMYEAPLSFLGATWVIQKHYQKKALLAHTTPGHALLEMAHLDPPFNNLSSVSKSKGLILYYVHSLAFFLILCLSFSM